MNHNNKPGFFAYIWKFERFFCTALIIGLLVMASVILASDAGDERTSALRFCGALAVVVYGASFIKLRQSYRDYLNNTSR